MTEQMLYSNIKHATADFTDLLLADPFFGNDRESDCRAWYSELQKLGSGLIYTSELVEYGKRRIQVKTKLRRRHLVLFVALSFGFFLCGAGAVASYARFQKLWMPLLLLAAAYICCAESIRHINETEVDLHPDDPNPFRRWISN